MCAGPLRAGTVSHVLSQAASQVTPLDRVGTMNPSDGSPVTGHTQCEVNRPGMRGESLAAHFVNDLFPASQGVVDSPAVSHCMRYAIEVARVAVMSRVTVAAGGGTNGTISREAILASMSSTAASWKARCAAQIDLLGICVMTKALDAKGGTYSTGNPTRCAFRLDGGQFVTAAAYITPGCLVYVYGTAPLFQPTLHDPCQFHDCTGEVPLVLNVATQIKGESRTLVLFDPTKMVDPLEVRGAWASQAPVMFDNLTRMDQGVYDTFLAGVAAWHDDLTKDLPGRITDTSLFRRSLINEEATGVGGPNNHGSASNRPLKSATEADTRHCDMMQVS